MPPIQADEFNDDTRSFLDKWSGGFFKDADKNPVLLTFAHHPKLAELFSQLNVHLLTTNSLPVKQRQIAIMRTAWICKATYMWSSHLNTSRMVGLQPDMYGPIQAGADDPYFTDFERTVIRATDELVTDKLIGEANWQALMQEWSNQQMLDFLFTVGAYVTVAGVMKSTGVQRQEDLIALADRYGEPNAVA
jgi:alkylhydroperoxidase family enzyme